MSANSSSSEAVGPFAQICAALDRGFDGRADVLAAAGLNEADWQSLCDKWLPQLAAPDLGLTFARAYEQARERLALAEAALVGVVMAELDGEDTLVDANGPERVDAEVTVSVALPLAGPALPFRGPSFVPPAADLPAPAELPHRPLPAQGDAAEVTLEAASAALPAQAALPFQTPSSNSPRQRLLHFDPHTGRPLESPRWVDDSDP
jgi:hypothetical protein